MSTSYRCFKHFNISSFLYDLGSDLESFSLSNSNVDDDFTDWFSIIQKQLDKHAPIKTRRVKAAYSVTMNIFRKILFSF